MDRLPILKRINMNGYNRFEFFLNNLNILFAEAEMQENTGWWLYKNDARTPAFMLEGLAKIYKHAHDEEEGLKKIKDDCKLLEDALGAVDYYDNLAIDIGKIPEIKKEYLSFINKKAAEKIAVLNELLTDRKWIAHKRNRIERCREKLSNINWKTGEEEITGLRNYYRQEIDEINSFIDSRNGKFTNLEDEVHEFRRKIRWLSIYPKALNGAIQLCGNIEQKPELQNYFTPDILQSPYNKMPSPEEQEKILYLSKPDFFALSWMISAIGKLKDKGLNIYGLAEAISAIEKVNEEEAIVLAAKLNGHEGDTLNNILSEASALIRSYQQSKSLDHLLA